MSTTEDQILSNLQALGFDNPSDVALFKKVAEAAAGPIDTTLQEFANSENRILNTITIQRYGKSGYYQAVALAFQFGDDLVEDPVTHDPVYAVIDTSKQIVAQAAFEEIKDGNNSQLFLKVAALDTVTGNLVQLDPGQFAAFEAYFNNFEVPGLPVTLINAVANILSFSSNASYSPTYDLSGIQSNVSNALVKFKQTFEFNGLLFVGDLQDYIKANVPGIRDFFVFNTSIDNVAFNGSISLTSGYFNFIATILDNITYKSV